MRVIVYVEGASDEDAMQECLKPLLEQKDGEGIAITFKESPPGDKKKTLLTKVPRLAVNILRNNAEAMVVVIPDLYPPHRAFRHETAEELQAGIVENFRLALQDKGIDDQRIMDRFKVFCFKYDLEALVLAAEEALKLRLGVKNLKRTWRLPVEDQNHDHPPSRVIDDLFREHHQSYKKRADAPLILGMSQYLTIAERCPQCFKPFVEFLAAL